MPTILFRNGYRFFFYTNDHPPPHIHIERENKTAKFNLEPVALILSKRYNAKELSEIRKLVAENSTLFKTKWNEYFNNS